MAISTPMLVTFCVYIFGMILIGFIAWRSTKNFDDYILGGRSLGPFVTALSAGASDMSGWLLMGLPRYRNASQPFFLLFVIFAIPLLAHLVQNG